MSEVTRYDHIVPEYHRPDDVMFEDKDGDYVLYEDHARLMALVKALPVLSQQDRAMLSGVLYTARLENLTQPIMALLQARKEMGGELRRISHARTRNGSLPD